MKSDTPTMSVSLLAVDTFYFSTSDILENNYDFKSRFNSVISVLSGLTSPLNTLTLAHYYHDIILNL